MTNRKFTVVAATICAVLFLLAGCASVPKITQSAEEILFNMTTEEKVAQLFVICVDQLDLKESADDTQSLHHFGHTKLTSRMKSTLRQYPVGGFCLFAKNIKSKRQLKKLNRDLKNNCAIDPMLAVDEEGGRVARLAQTKSLGLTNVGAMEEIGATGDMEKAREAGKYIGSYLAEYGFTFDFAPVVDVNTNPENIVIGNRAFGSDPQLVSDMAGAFLDGLHAQGIKGCIKHFPGHGDTKGNTHEDYVAVDKTWEDLLTCELIPYKANLNRADTVMVAHVTMTKASSDGLPASLSKDMIMGKLRGELGYQGIILTDALNMGAIEKNFGSAKASVLAFEAGNDILLMPEDFPLAYEAMLYAVKTGEITMERLDESVLRILKLKGY
ncbi:MAG: hypothetical protein IJS09_09485 [Treponema sp.]|nr:hypothetical protein [Treponema sp.]